MFRLESSLFVAALCFAGTSAMAQSTANLTDPQIAHIAYTAGQSDIAAADLALNSDAQQHRQSPCRRDGGCVTARCDAVN
jgi:predicted outer membrane protein